MPRSASRKPGDDPSTGTAGSTEPRSEQVAGTGEGPGEEPGGEVPIAAAPLNRAERRARKKGGPKPDALGKLPRDGQQQPRGTPAAHAPRQWAMRRSG